MNEDKIREFYDKTAEGYQKFRENDRFDRFIKSLKHNRKTLSLGCGSGREVKALRAMNHAVVAVDFSENMIKLSKKIEPKAEYHLMDVVEFAEKNKNKMKFDYILGLFSLLNYIPRKNRRMFIENLHSMLDKDGLMVFEVRRVTDRWKDVVKSILAYLFYGAKEFGDVRNEGYFSHHFTKSQIREIFRGYRYKLSGNWIFVKK